MSAVRLVLTTLTVALRIFGILGLVSIIYGRSGSMICRLLFTPVTVLKLADSRVTAVSSLVSYFPVIVLRLRVSLGGTCIRVRECLGSTLTDR